MSLSLKSLSSIPTRAEGVESQLIFSLHEQEYMKRLLAQCALIMMKVSYFEIDGFAHTELHGQK